LFADEMYNPKNQKYATSKRKVRTLTTLHAIQL
jgi:hypothetical protein